MFKNVKKFIILFFFIILVICKYEKGIVDDFRNDKLIKECYVNLISIVCFIDLLMFYEIFVCSL